MKTLSFFGKEGLTSTSANHIANLAKEYVRNAHEELASIRFYNEKINLLTNDTTVLASRGIESDKLTAILDTVKLISDANSLIAFLREAIKEKDRKMKEAKDYHDDDAWQVWQDSYAQHSVNKPLREEYPTAEDIKQTWSVGQQEKYLSLEAEAAAIGKFIHPDGYLANARIDLMSKLQNPTFVQLNGSETIVHSYSPTVDLEYVDEIFNELQNRYRSVQAELNGMKKCIDDEIFRQTQYIDQQYAQAMQKYDDESKALSISKHRIEENERDTRAQMLVDARDLKIVIPNRLKPIYDLVQGK